MTEAARARHGGARVRVPAAVGAGLLLAGLLLAGCGGAGSGDRVAEREITVLAAASLTEVFTDLGTRFERANPGVSVRVDFGASSGLAHRIEQGVPADVFAAAAPSAMDRLGPLATEPRVFARNEITIAVPARPGPGRSPITALTDLARPGVAVAVCQEQVPCGALARAAFEAAGVEVRPATEEADVKGVLTKVRLGEVDAGLVYGTDLRAAGDDVRAVALPTAARRTTDYPIAVLRDTHDPATARAFVDLVTSDAGRAALRGAGFGLP